MDLWHEYKKDKEQKTKTDLWQEYLKQREAYGLPAEVQWKKPEKPIAVTGVPRVKLNPLTGSAMPNTPYANPKARSREFMMASEKATQQQERYAALHQQYGTKYESGNIPIDTLSAGIENTEQHIQELEEKIEYFRGSSGSVYGNGEVYTNTPETPEQQSEQSQAILEERKTAEAELEQERKRLEAMLDEYDYYWTRAFLASQSDENYAFTAASGKKAYEQQWKERSRLAAQRDNAEYLGTENVVDADRVRTAVDTYSAEHPAAVSIEHMSDEEKEMFYYLVGSGNDQMAAAYANECAVASRRERIKQIEDWAGKNVWTGIAAHLAQGLLFPLAGADMLLAGNDIKNTGLDVSTNIGPAALKDSMNSGISQKMNSWGTIPEQVPFVRGKGLGDLYSLGVSMNESYGSAMAFGPFAIAFMGMSAASSTYNDAISRGASHEQAQRQGLAAGIAEALFEKISIGHFLDGKDYGSFIKNLLVQGGVEASEEALTSLTNEIVDRANMMNLSTFETNVRGYMDDGMSRKEAEKRANRDFWEGVAYDALGGFLTGGVMGGSSTLVQNAQKVKKVNKAVDAIMEGKGLRAYQIFAEQAGVTEADSDAEARKKFKAFLKEKMGLKRNKKESILESTQIDDDPNGHTAEEIRIIEEYKSAVDPKLVEFVEESKSSGKANDLFSLEKVSEKAAADIANITGIDVTGFRTAIERRQIWHILKRHGENGRANQSMSDANDIARIQYILNNYDTVAPGGTSSSYTTMKENGRSAQAQVVLFSKKIDGTYYVAEAVPNTKRKTLFVTSAFIDQNGQKETGTSQLVNAQKSPVETPEASSVSVPDSGSSAQLLNRDDSMSSPQFTSRTPTGVETSATGSIARLDENYNTDGGNVDESTEIFDDGGQRNAGMGAGGQAGTVAEGTGRSVSRSQARAEAAVLSHIKGNAQAQSPREIGVEDGSTEQSLYVLSDEDIAQSERWKRIKADAEADGARAVLFAGDLKVYNRSTKEYSKVEGIHQTDSEGNTTYYIKADKHSRNAEQIYIHEKFHDIVSRNPGLLPALMEELEERYGQQEIAALVNSYVEAYDGIYGRLDESMTADEQQELVYRYMEEVFADVYAGIKRGARSTASAKKVMESQTDTIQRAAQNRKATGQKTAPPDQSFSLSPTKRAKLEQLIDELGRKNIRLIANGKTISIKTDDFTKDKAIYSEKGRSKKEINARIKAIPFFGDILKRSNYAWTDTDIVGVNKKAKKGVVAMHHFTSNHEGFEVDIVIRDKGNAQFLYEMKFIENKKSSKQSMTEKSASTAPKGDVWNNETVAQPDNKVKQEFSVEDDAAELDAEYARKMAEDDTPEGMAEDDEKIEDYNALARAEKERRAEAAPRNRLKSRIKASENEIRVQTEAKNALKTAGLLTNELKEQIDKKIALVRETLKIDKAALKRKEQSLEQQKKEDRKRQTEARIKMQKAQIAQKELAEDLINLFSVKKGVRLEMLEMINEFSDELIRSGRLTNDKRQELFRILYENGEDIIEADEYYRDVRMALKGYRIYVSDSVRAEFGDDWESFRKSAWGNRIYLTDDIKDMGIDSVTQEMAEIFGGHFDGEADLKTQLETILELAEEGKAERVTLDEMMRRHKNEYGWSIEEQMDDLEQKVDRILETFAEKASIEIRLRQKNIAQLAKEREGFRRVLEERQQQKMENQARNNVMRSIQKLSRMRKKASPEFRKMIDECLKDIDTVARSISPRGLEDLQELERLYLEQKEAQGSDFLSSPYVEARLNRLNKKQLDDMGIDEVRELGRLVCSITNAIQNSNKLLADAKKESIHQAAKEVNAEVAASKGSKGGKGAEYFLSHIDGKRFFGHISGWARGRLEALGQALSTGQERMMRYQMNAMRIVDPFLASKDNRQWLKTAEGKNAEWITIKIPDGFKITEDGLSVTVSEVAITPMMRVSLLLHSMNEDNLRHIKGGGIRIPDRAQYSKGNMKEAYARGKLVKMDPSTVRAIVKECTAQEREFAKFLMRYFNQFSKDKINEVSMVLDGFERAGGEHYFHIKTDPAFLEKQNDTIKRDLSVLSTGSIVNERIHASNPIVLQDATDALMEHIESISKYYGFAVPLRDLNAVLSHTFHQEDNAFSGSVMDTIKRKWGTGAEEYLDKLMADLQLPERNSDLLSGLLAKIRGNYAKAVISANLSSLLKQITSYPVAVPYLKTDALLHGLSAGSMKNDVKTLEKYSAVYWYRNQGNATMELSDVMKQREFGDGLPWLFNATQKMDSAVTRRLLAACEFRVQKDMKLAPGSQSDIEAGTDRYWTEVAKLFNDVVLKTQSNSTMMERPQITRANASNVSRFLTMFRTDAFQQFNMLVEAKGRLSAAKKAFDTDTSNANRQALKNAKSFAARTVAGTLFGQTVVAAITNLLKLARFDDEEYRDEEGNFDWGKFLTALGLDIVEGYAGFMVGIDTLYSAAYVAIDNALGGDSKWYDVEVNALASFNDLLESVVKLGGMLGNCTFREGLGAIKDTAMAASKIFGIPAQNIEKYLLMAVRWISPEWAEKYENVWDETTKDSLSNESQNTIHAAVSVLIDNRMDGVSDEDKTEITRLYIAGGNGAVPSGIPTSVKYTQADGEEITAELSAKQRKQYREVWSDTVSSAIGELLASEEYERADDEKKTEYIDKLYKYASQIARNAVVPEKELEKWVQQGIDAADNGIPISEYITFRVDMGDITGKNASGEGIDGLAMQRKMDLLESMGWSDKQEREIYLDVLVDDGETRQKKAGEIDALLKAGLNWDQANDIVISSQSKKLKWEAIANMNLSQQEKADAMAIYANESEKNLIRTGLAYGIKMEWYAEVMNNADKNGKGGVDQEEAKEYIYGMDLSYFEQTYLWQMVTDAKYGASNPFSEGEAKLFWYDAHENDPAEED